MSKLSKSKKSQVIIVSIMISVLVLILIIIMSTPLIQETNKARNGTFSGNLSTSNTAISTPNRATLIVLDMIPFYFIGSLVAISIAFLSGRRTFTGVPTAIIVFIITSVLISPLKGLIILARDSSHLNCTSAAISVGNRLACLFVDIWLFYFVVTAIAAAATFIFITRVVKK